MTGLGPDARAVRAALTDARALCSALGLLDGFKKRPRGVLIRCPNPAHRDHHPSCSVRPGPDGTLAAHCFTCEWSGDALDLVALARGLDRRADFPDVVEAAADIAGGAFVAGEGPARPMVEAAPSYPPAADIAALWAACAPLERARRRTAHDGQVDVEQDAHEYFRGRAIDPGMVDLYDLARVLPPGEPCPRWARVRRRPWSETEHRIVVPMVDHTGELRSLRAWRLPGEGLDLEQAGDEMPKRVAPAGHSTIGLVMACPVARRMLTTGQAPGYLDGAPLDVVICEGEPDFLTWAARSSDASATPPAVLGVVSAAWSQAVADRIPEGSRVFIRTHRDDTGDRYAAAIRDSLNDRLVEVLDFDRRKGRDGQAA